MIFEAFLIGGIAFWIVTAILIIDLFVMLDREMSIGAGISILLYLGVLAAFTSFNPFLWAFANWQLSLAYFGAYFLVAVVWATIKWWWLGDKRLRVYKEQKESFYREFNNLDDDSPVSSLVGEQKDKFWRRMADAFIDEFPNDEDFKYKSGSVFNPKPVVSDNKGRLTIWMMCWPLSMVWTILSDFLKETFKKIYDACRKTWQRISDRQFASIESDFEDEDSR